METDKPLVLVCGCTGTGKSDLGIEIAKAFDGEVISADSMQIYKGLDIATNKVTEEEMSGVPHHMMSFYEPNEDRFNVHQFRTEVLRLIADMQQRKKLPVIVGGTAYYIESILYQNYLIDTEQSTSDSIQESLEKHSTEKLYSMLHEIDPESASQIHRNNRYRVIRALEIFHSTGKKKSEFLAEQKSKVKDDRNHLGGMLQFKNTLLINLDAKNELLIERLNKRVTKMVERGLRHEIEQYYDKYSQSFGSYGVMQSIGIKEFLPYLELNEMNRKAKLGDDLFKEGCEYLKIHTRQYSKRQRNWLYKRILMRSKTREVPAFITLDTSRNFFEEIVPFALDYVRAFLAGNDMTQIVSPESHLFIMKLPMTENMRALEEICERDIHGLLHFQNHIESRAHKKMSVSKKRKELVSLVETIDSVLMKADS
ncbi:IPP transferase domain-containing protein [Ditylenchus destructor]|nr:IPP transferase domain-containing protein [Ditylenchus destructor]